MPPPKELKRVNREVMELIAAAEKEKIEIFFEQEERGKYNSLTMQVRNAIALFRQAQPKDVPDDLKKLHAFAPFLGCALSVREGKFELGPKDEIGMGALISNALRKIGRVPDPALLMSDRQIAKAKSFKFDPDQPWDKDKQDAQPTTFNAASVPDLERLKKAVETAPAYLPPDEGKLNQCLPPDPRTLVD